MNDPFRGNVPALLERERLLKDENRSLETEVERLRAVVGPVEGKKDDLLTKKLPLLIIALCVLFQGYLLARSSVPVRHAPTSVGPHAAPATVRQDPTQL